MQSEPPNARMNCILDSVFAYFEFDFTFSLMLGGLLAPMAHTPHL